MRNEFLHQIIRRWYCRFPNVVVAGRSGALNIS